MSNPHNQSFPISIGVFKHIRTGVLYRVLCESFDVETQRAHVVYVSQENGGIFNRDKEIFCKNFTYVTDVIIAPKDKA